MPTSGAVREVICGLVGQSTYRHARWQGDLGLQAEDLREGSPQRCLLVGSQRALLGCGLREDEGTSVAGANVEQFLVAAVTQRGHECLVFVGLDLESPSKVGYTPPSMLNG